MSDFYPRPPRGGRRFWPCLSDDPVQISIHALREEGDVGFLAVPAQRAISIHALREEGDALPEMSTSSGVDFYPRPPRGGRRDLLRYRFPASAISIHALREEGDLAGFIVAVCLTNFYPRPPRGGRRQPPG